MLFSLGHHNLAGWMCHFWPKIIGQLIWFILTSKTRAWYLSVLSLISGSSPCCQANLIDIDASASHKAKPDELGQWYSEKQQMISPISCCKYFNEGQTILPISSRSVTVECPEQRNDKCLASNLQCRKSFAQCIPKTLLSHSKQALKVENHLTILNN